MNSKLCKVSDVPEGKGIVVPCNSDLEIALFKVGGKIFALNNVCPHMGGPLGEGEIEGTTVTCPWHGWQFNCTDGECLNMPGENATKVPITIQGDDIYLA